MSFKPFFIPGKIWYVHHAAVECAKSRGLEVVEYLPNLEGCKERHEFTERYYARNQLIVDNSDLIVAFTEKEHGGTWNIIKQARKANKPVKIIKPSLMFPTTEQLPEEQQVDCKENELVKDSNENTDSLEDSLVPENIKKGAGPFAIKRVSLGSYALRRKLYISSEEWLDIVNMKDNKPQLLAEKMFPAFMKFFESSKKFGIIHAVTVPPRSKRNLDKIHCMDLLAKKVAESLGTFFIVMFEP